MRLTPPRGITVVAGALPLIGHVTLAPTPKKRMNRGQVHFNKMLAHFWTRVIVGHAKGVAIPICGSGFDEEAMEALRRGWYLGEAGFRDRLLAMIEKTSAKRRRPTGIAKSHGEAEAERLAHDALAALGMPDDRSSLANIRKGKLEKVLVAALLRERTAIGNSWIAQRLAMGHSGSVSRLVEACGKSVTQTRELRKLKRMLKCAT